MLQKMTDGKGKSQLGQNVRVLIHEFGGIVDFIVHD